MKQKLVGRRFLMDTWSVTSVISELVTFPLTIVPEGMQGVAEKVETAQQEGKNTSRECKSVK